MSKIYRLASDCPGRCGPMPFSYACNHTDHIYLSDAIYCEKAQTDIYDEDVTLVCSVDNGKTWTNLNWTEIESLLQMFGYQLHPNRAQHLTVTSVYGTHLADVPTSHCKELNYN